MLKWFERVLEQVSEVQEGVLVIPGEFEKPLEELDK